MTRKAAKTPKQDPTKPKRGRPPKNPHNLPLLPKRANAKIDLNKAIDLRIKGLTYQEIADHFGSCRQSVQERLAPYVDTVEGIDIGSFKDRRADILAAKQQVVLSALNPDKIKEASARDQVIIFGTLYDKERLERGQSTSNAAVVIASACRTSLDDE